MAERATSRRGLLGHIAGAGFAAVALRHHTARASEPEETGSVCHFPGTMGEADKELCALWPNFRAVVSEYVSHEERAAPLHQYCADVMKRCMRRGMSLEVWRKYVEQHPKWKQASAANSRASQLLTVADELGEAISALPARTLGGAFVKVGALAYWCGEYGALCPPPENASDEDFATAHFRDLLNDLERMMAADPASAHLLPLLGIEPAGPR